MNVKTIAVIVFSLTTLLTVSPALAADDEWLDEPANVRLHLRSGAAFFMDESADAFTDDPVWAFGEIGADYGLNEHLWFGVAFHGGSFGDVLHGAIDTDVDINTLRAHVAWRTRLWAPLALSARLGPGVTWIDQSIGLYGDRLSDNTRVYSAHGAIALEYFPLHSGGLVDSFEAPDAGLGVSFALTYDQYPTLDFIDGGTNLGDLNLSGPGLVWGLVYQF